MPNRSRQKGDRAERELKAILIEAGVPCRKIPSSGAGPDFPGDLYVGEAGYERIFEVKVRDHGFKQLYKWLEGAYALAFCSKGRGSTGEWIVALRLSDLLRIAREGKL